MAHLLLEAEAEALFDSGGRTVESAGVISGKSVFSVLPASKPNCGLRNSRVAPSKVPVFGGKFGSCGDVRGPRGVSRSGFCDDGHVRYYGNGGARCVGGGSRKEEEEGKVERKRMKLLDGLTRDLAVFIEMGFGVDGDVDQWKRISESAEVLLKQLEQLKAEEKELKRRKKEEKAKMKAEKMKGGIVSESSSSESSDSECGEVFNLSCLKASVGQQFPEEPQTTTSQTLVAVEVRPTILPIAEENSIPRGSAEVLDLSDDRIHLAPATTKIQVCMGNKCKKSWSTELLAEFERVVGLEGAVVGCKCLGKCGDGPNVRVLNSSDENHARSSVLDDSVRTPANPLCMGVGLKDVGVIVANFLGNDSDLGPNPMTAYSFRGLCLPSQDREIAIRGESGLQSSLKGVGCSIP